MPRLRLSPNGRELHLAGLRIAFTLTTLLAGVSVLIISGCGLVSGPTENQEEHREVEHILHRNELLRANARRRAARIERTFPLQLKRTATHGNCAVVFRRPQRPRSGIAPVSCRDFPAPWPFKVQYGFLRCEMAHHTPTRRRVIFSTPRGRDFAVNVYARIVGYAKISTLLSHPRTDGPRARLLLGDRGLDLCR